MKPHIDSLIVQLCNEIDDLKEYLLQIQEERDYYKSEFNCLLNKSISNNEVMMKNMLDVFLTDGVTEAFAKGKTNAN